MEGDIDVRPTRVEVDLDAIGRNIDAIRAHVGGAGVMPVLKANAYGHGIIEVGRYLDRMGVQALAVAYLEEGEALRAAGVESPILVLSGLVGRQLPRFFASRLTITVPSVGKLEQVQQAASDLGTRAQVHLKFDTGMGRLGQSHRTAETLLDATRDAPDVDVEGVFSHFATADEADLGLARQQLDRFLEILQWYARNDLPTPTRHIANSGGILQLPESHLDLVRPGILTYGVFPSRECSRPFAVEPALSWHTQVVYFKVVPRGESVSYGATWRADTATRVVTLPVGYGDGYWRAHSNTSDVLIGGRRRRIVGRVCMDHTMVGLGEDGSAFNGDDVVLLGGQGENVITVEELAEHAGTIPYEILTSISSRVPRVYRGGL